MATKKHLVLDHDVHLRLQRRKKDLGMPIKEIGNSILRVCLDKSIPLIEFLRDELVAMGKVTLDEYDAAIKQAMEMASRTYTTDDAFLPSGEEGDAICGSWTIQCLHNLNPDNIRIYCFSTHDMRKLMTPSHYHSQDMHALVLSGVVAFHLETDQHHLSVNSGLHIPAGRVHSKVPLTPDARMLVALVDPGTEDSAASKMLSRVRTT
ncbi:hypothetical protein IH601_02360 [Candidatus Bipolaricaulota bacterium]|nr:hypothetical protein [Candidatus Bipolaricaulota bacterium]TFH10206.1 MAG: hypothetical protein E4H08_04105 [Candidatus Atribacteria bacterium]